MREGRLRSKNEVRVVLARASAKMKRAFGMPKLCSAKLKNAAEIVAGIIDVALGRVGGDEEQRDTKAVLIIA